MDTLDSFRDLFDAARCAAAERLVSMDCVREVRVLNGGAVIAGVVQTAGPDSSAARGRTHRVYVTLQSASADPSVRYRNMEAECGCSDPAPCVHVLAVLMSAGRSESRAPARRASIQGQARASGPARVPPPSSSATSRQRLYYVLEPRGAGELGLSIWVGQSTASDNNLPQPGSARPFAHRALAYSSTGTQNLSDLPRYVDAEDVAVLGFLRFRDSDASWQPAQPLTAEQIRQIVDTGRAFWRSLQTAPLRAGSIRRVDFVWYVLADGTQQLRCAPPDESLELIVHPAYALYVDPSARTCGKLELPFSHRLLQEMWTRPPLAPENAPDLIRHLQSEPGTERFPRPRALAVRREQQRSLTAVLVLQPGASAPTSNSSTASDAHPEAVLHFSYNGLPAAHPSSSAPHAVARCVSGEDVIEIDRDIPGEQSLQARLDRALASAVRGSRSFDASSRVDWLTFLISAVPELRSEGWEIRIDERFPHRIALPDRWYGELATPADSEDWFDLRLGVLVDGTQVNLLPALVSFLQAELSGDPQSLHIDDTECVRGPDHLFIRLDDGRYLPVPLDRVKRIAHTMVELHDRGELGPADALRLPRRQLARVAQVADVLDGAAFRADDPVALRTISGIASLTRPEPLHAPPGFRATLRAYQQQGLGWLQALRQHEYGGILADDMGLGKTVQTLAHLAWEKQHGRLSRPSLIVAPVSVVPNWQREAMRLAPELNVVTLHGSRRRHSFQAAAVADVIIVGYPSLLHDADFLMAREFEFVILDEAHAIKNPRARVSQAARALRARHRLCLTGTPVENHLGELWSLCEFLQPGLLGSEKSFQRHYRTPIEKERNTQRFEALCARIAPFLLRRTKDAVARELPPKTEIIEPIELDEAQRDFYDGIRLAMHRRVREAIEQHGLARSHITVLDALLRLRQACCDPRLVKAADSTVEAPSERSRKPAAAESSRFEEGADASAADTGSIPSAKMDWLVTMLPELVSEGRRILLFSQFKAMLHLIEDTVRELGIPYCLLTGDTQQRDAVIERFQSGSVPLFLISLKAGGTGLNLTAADTVIHYDPWWNPAVEAQATDRAYRIGQDKPVFVYKLIAQRTVEEKVLRLQADKRALVSELYAQQSAALAQLDRATVEELFDA